MKNKIIILLIGMVLLVGFVIAEGEIATLTQAQIDNINIEQVDAYILSLCDSDGLVYVYGETVYTRYECPYVEKIESNLYHVYMGDYFTSSPLENYYNITSQTYVGGEENATNAYWGEVVRQALETVHANGLQIRDYQTPSNPFENWIGEIFG
jgi:hypothetical protein